MSNIIWLQTCDDDATASDDEDDGDASSSSADEMSTWHFYPLPLVTKMGSSFGYESSHLGGELV